MVGKSAFYSRCYDERDLNINRHRPSIAKTINQEKQKTRSAEIESPKKVSNDFLVQVSGGFIQRTKLGTRVLKIQTTCSSK